MYTPSEYLQSAIKNRNMIQIYNELCSILHKDPAFTTNAFSEALNFVKRQHVSDVIQPHDQRLFALKDNWDKNYWALVVSDLMDNFSTERIYHVEEVGRHLFKPKVTIQSTHKGFSAESHATNVSKRPSVVSTRTPGPVNRNISYGRSRGSFGRNNGVKKIIPVVSITAGVLLLGIAAIGIKKTALIVGTVVVVGGAALILSKKKW